MVGTYTKWTEKVSGGMRGLTFELSRPARQDAWAARCSIDQGSAPPKWPAVWGRLERRVRHQPGPDGLERARQPREIPGQTRWSWTALPAPSQRWCREAAASCAAGQ